MLIRMLEMCGMLGMKNRHESSKKSSGFSTLIDDGSGVSDSRSTAKASRDVKQRNVIQIVENSTDVKASSTSSAAHTNVHKAKGSCC